MLSQRAYHPRVAPSLRGLLATVCVWLVAAQAGFGQYAVDQGRTINTTPQRSSTAPQGGINFTPPNRNGMGLGANPGALGGVQTPPAVGAAGLTNGANGYGGLIPPNNAPTGQPSVLGPARPPVATAQAAYGVAPSNYGNDAFQVFPGGDAPVVQPGRPRILDRDILVTAPETTTGRLQFGVGVNSSAGLTGSIVLDEQNFDIMRYPRSWADIRGGNFFRGAGQHLRIEAMPGTQVNRYSASFTEPYLFDTPVSLGLSGYYYTRQFLDWNEQRLGGRVSLGYEFTKDLTGSVAFRGEEIKIYNAAVPAPDILNRAIGANEAYGFQARLAHDTRDSAFLPTQGHYAELGFEQTIGSFVYPRGTIDLRQYFMLHERPDHSGRHVISLSTRFGISGDDTPIYDRFFQGQPTLRGFRFRGASPRELGVTVGGNMEWVNSAEYLFPITADDTLRGVVFCDFGTVEQNYNIDWDNFRVSPGLGLRISMPALGPAPIALDFAFPVARATDDRVQNFSFSVGLLR